MEELTKYLDEIAEPTVAEFEKNPTSVRHAFLACVALFHTVDYLAFPETGRAISRSTKIVGEAHVFSKRGSV
jgi:hypothetical protein